VPLNLDVVAKIVNAPMSFALIEFLRAAFCGEIYASDVFDAQEIRLNLEAECTNQTGI
jgi:hypothetical protein